MDPHTSSHPEVSTSTQVDRDRPACVCVQSTPDEAQQRIRLTTTSAILLFEESVTLRKAISGHLASAGFSVIPAGSLAEAAAALEGARIAVAIVGHTAAGSDASELLRRLSATGKVPAILITDSPAVRQLSQDVLPAITEVLVRNRFSLAELDRVVAKTMGRP